MEVRRPVYSRTPRRPMDPGSRYAHMHGRSQMPLATRPPPTAYTHVPGRSRQLFCWHPLTLPERTNQSQGPNKSGSSPPEPSHARTHRIHTVGRVPARAKMGMQRGVSLLAGDASADRGQQPRPAKAKPTVALRWSIGSRPGCRFDLLLSLAKFMNAQKGNSLAPWARIMCKFLEPGLPVRWSVIILNLERVRSSVILFFFENLMVSPQGPKLTPISALPSSTVTSIVRPK